MDNTKKTIKYQSSTVVAIIFMLTAATLALHQFKVPMIMGAIAEDLNMGDSATWLMSAFTLTGIFLAIPAGGISQKYGPKNMVIVAAILVALGSIIGSFATNGTVIIISRAIEGIGFILVSVAGPMSIVKYCEPSTIGGAMGIWAVWVPVGQIIAFNLTPVLFKSTSWNNIWMVYAVASIIMAFVVKAGIKEPVGLDSINSENADTVKPTISEALKNRDIITGALAFATFNYVLMAVLAFLPIFAGPGTAVNMSTTEVGFVSTIPMIGALIGSPIIGRMSDKMGRKKLYMVAILATGIGAALAFSPNRILIYLGTGLIGLIGLGTPAMILSAVGEIMKKEELIGLGNGFLFLCQNLGMFLGTATFLALVSMVGSFTTAGFVCAGIAIVGVVLANMTEFN